MPGVCKSRKGACAARMERTGEEGVRGVAEGGGRPGGIRWWFWLHMKISWGVFKNTDGWASPTGVLL